MMNAKFSLNHFIKEQRLTLVDVTFLSILESLLFVAQFYFIGKAIKDLLQESFSGVYILIALFAAKLLVSYFKQVRIRKSYKAIYEELVVQAIGEPLIDGEEVGAIALRSTIIHETATFFKSDLVKGFETVVRLVFVLIALLILNKTIFFVSLGIALIVHLLYQARRMKIINLSKSLADELQRQQGIYIKRDRNEIYEYHEKLERLDDKLLRISGTNLSIIEALSFGLILFSIVFLVRTEGQNAISAFITLLYYVMAFSESTYLLPSLYQKFLRIQAMSENIT